MVRTLRAFAWMRWRTLMNSLERTGSRDKLERFSLAIERLGPLLAAALMVPSAAALAALGAFAGMAIARGETTPVSFQAARYLLLAVPLLAVIGPFLLPAADRTNAVRLLLLPIPRSTLYLAQSASAFGDPWNVLAIPLILAIAAGLLGGGAPLAALATLAGAILLIAILVGIASLATTALHLMVRDRRRGELIALAFIIVLPLVSLVPTMLTGGAQRSRARPVEAREPQSPGWMASGRRLAVAVLPTEMYLDVARSAAAGDYRRAGGRLGALGAVTLLLHAAASSLFARALSSPGSSGARRAAPMRQAWGRRLPGLSIGASAVALTQLRLAMRTARGRSILLSPLMMFLFFGVMMYRGSGSTSLGPFNFTSGFGLATFTSFVCLLSMLPIAMNQFAVDKAGLTRALLSPLSDAEFLAGKAAGNALIVMVPAAVCIGGALMLFPGGSPALWLTLPPGLLAILFVISPVAAIGSAMFPRVVDLNSIGRAGNAHGAANLIGLLSFAGAAAVPVGLTVLATSVIGRPALAPVFVVLWCAVAYAACRLMFGPARRVFNARRENLAMLE